MIDIEDLTLVKFQTIDGNEGMRAMALFSMSHPEHNILCQELAVKFDWLGLPPRDINMTIIHRRGDTSEPGRFPVFEVQFSRPLTWSMEHDEKENAMSAFHIAVAEAIHRRTLEAIELYEERYT